MPLNIDNKKPVRTKCIKGWYRPQMQQFLDFVFKSCFVDCEIIESKEPKFLCRLAHHVDRTEVDDFTANFLVKNGINMHFQYLIDTPRKP